MQRLLDPDNAVQAADAGPTGLTGLARTAAAVWRRQGASTPLIDQRIVAAAVFHKRAGLLAAGSPLALGNLSAVHGRIRAQFPDLAPGDLVLTNDPYSGGRATDTFYLHSSSASITDVSLLLQFPTADFGGETLGGFFPGATEIWAEGARVTPLLLGGRDRPDRRVLDLLALNSRIPTNFSGDVAAAVETLSAMDASLATDALRSECGHAVEREGNPLDLASTTGRGARWSGNQVIDTGCAAAATGTIRLGVRVTTGNGIEVDLTDSDAAQPSFVNATIATARSAVLLPLALALPASSWNQRLLDAVSLVVEPGTVASADLPHATGWGPYGTARAIASLVTDACAPVGVDVGRADRWLSNPVFRFATPFCGCTGCAFPALSAPPNHAATYVPELSRGAEVLQCSDARE